MNKEEITIEVMNALLLEKGINKSGFLKECGITRQRYDEISRGDYALSPKIKDKLWDGILHYQLIFNKFKKQ